MKLCILTTDERLEREMRALILHYPSWQIVVFRSHDEAYLTDLLEPCALSIVDLEVRDERPIVKNRRPPSRDYPTIVVGYDSIDSEAAERAFREEALEYMQKPIDMTRVAFLINILMRGGHLQQRSVSEQPLALPVWEDADVTPE